MKTILQRRLERQAISPIRRVLAKYEHLYTAGVNSRTPTVLAEEVLDRLTIDWSNPKLRILDVKSNCGTFSMLIIERLLDAGHDIKHILDEMIYAVDTNRGQTWLSESAFQQAFGRGGNILRTDFSTWQANMKFDLIIGNPPFQETHEDGTRKAPSVNLWSKFWSKAIRLAADDGTVALITPLRWMNPGPDLSGEWKIGEYTRLWDVFNQYSSYANVLDVAKHFNGVGSTFGYVIVDKSQTGGLQFSDGASTELQFMPLSGHDRVFDELRLTDNLGDTFGVDQKNSPTLRVSIPMTRVLKPEVLEILDGKTQPVMGNESAHNYAYVYAPDQETAERIRDRIIDCFDILSRHCRYSGFMSRDIVKMIRYDK